MIGYSTTREGINAEQSESRSGSVIMDQLALLHDRERRGREFKVGAPTRKRKWDAFFCLSTNVA
jgi:hypothetical protein